MSDFKVGDRVRVVDHPYPEINGCGGVMTRVGSRWPTARLDGDDSDAVVYDCVVVETPAHIRLSAASAVARTEALLAQQRADLRAAWVAEIGALPVVAEAETFDEAIASIVALLGKQTDHYQDACDRQAWWWRTSAESHASLSQWEDGIRIGACAHGMPFPGGWRLADSTLDAAVKGALCWLAERDVFLLDRNDSEMAPL